ncbi:MAG: GHKL domain-containing protein [Bdellovibrionales bacterium]|nr:GHKL domain-containing protein [Bdellovibrionales bacterium]
MDETSGDIKIQCRSVEISQVFLNLLDNAFDAIHQLEEKWVRVELRDLDESIEMSFTDSGWGIPECLKDKIMQPFFTTKEVGKGTGLGLSIAHGIIEAHQGQLFLDSTSTHTRFAVRLPKQQGSLSAPSAAAS